MGKIGFPETSGRNYHYLLRSSLEELSYDAQVSGKGLSNRFYSRQEGNMQTTHKEKLYTINDTLKSPRRCYLHNGHVCIITTTCSKAALKCMGDNLVCKLYVMQNMKQH